MTDRKATLSVGDKSIELPVYSGTVGPDVIDVRGLVQEGVFTYDPGFVSTAACESAITYIDGANGVLLHRGYPIDQLAEHSDFLEVCYLLLNGELPSEEENKRFHDTIKNHTMLHDQMRNFSTASAVTRIRWPSCVALLAPCPRSITTRWTFPIPSNVKSPAIA